MHEEKGLMREDAPISASRRTDLPPGCKFANLDRSYTFESMIVHYA